MKSIPKPEKCPAEEANIFSRITFAWMYKIYKLTLQHDVHLNNTFEVLKEMSSSKLGDDIELFWKSELDNSYLKETKPDLYSVLRRMFLREFIVYAILQFICFCIFRVGQIVALSYFIRSFLESDPSEKLQLQCISGTSLVLLLILIVFTQHLAFYKLMCIGIKVETALSTLIYRKVIKLSLNTLSGGTSGKIISLLSNDMRFQEFLPFSSFIWIGPVQILIILVLSWAEVGMSCLAGFIFLIIYTIPVQVFIGKLSFIFRKTAAKETDKRLKVIYDILNGINVIKMFVWENALEKMVHNLRIKELQAISKSLFVNTLHFNVNTMVQKIATYLTIMMLIFLMHSAQAHAVFTVFAYFNTLRLTMVIYFPKAILTRSEIFVSISRIQEFLLYEEVNNSICEKGRRADVKMKNVKTSWPASSLLIDIPYLQVLPGSLCALVGPVGSGKSTILQILLGELPTIHGSVEVKGSISYCSQEPWLFGSTIRENILFGREYNEARYREVVYVCYLQFDFNQFSNGDNTLVGETGTILSGGQKSRVNLARALYAEADIYLLDDPLSAVDVPVARHIFEEAIMKFLRRKTRIWITYSIQFLKSVDSIIVLKDGTIESEGSFHELKGSTTDFSKNIISTLKNENKIRKELNQSNGSDMDFSNLETEVREEIAISKKLSFLRYLKGGNLSLFCLVVLLFILCQAVYTWTDFFLVLWTINQFSGNNSNSSDAYLSHFEIGKEHFETFDNLPAASKWNTIIYTVAIGVGIIVTIGRSLVSHTFFMKAAYKIHSEMSRTILRLPLSFYKSNPVGRILNRFSYDTSKIDEFLPVEALEAGQTILLLLGNLILVCFSNIFNVVAVLIVFACIIRLLFLFSKVLQKLTHLECLAKSPVFSYIKFTLQGITTIRASRQEHLVRKQFEDYQNTYVSASYIKLACHSSLAHWMDCLGSTLIVFATFAFIVRDYFGYYGDNIDSFVGLALSQLFNITGLLQYSTRKSAECISSITSTERIYDYVDMKKEETMDSVQKNIIPKNWPSSGTIQFIDVNIKYNSQEKYALKNINLSIYSEEKIGIVGRTGAGKSSLVAILFRLVNFEGNVYIDNININSVRLTDLRSRISIIPQDPILFSNTIRFNLDPFKEFTDNQLWDVLEKVNMKNRIRNLEDLVSEGNCNFSLGERQLLCLGRSLLKKAKIVLLDEATANVDSCTDIFVKNVIKNHFKTSTVITIAHRLHTIMDSDRIIVMDKGRIVQFNHAHMLLAEEKGCFFNMVQQTGSSMASYLKKIADEDYKLKHNTLNK